MMRVSVIGLVAFSFVLAAVLTLSGPGYAGSADGQKIFDAKNCGSCHQVKGPAAEKTIEDQLKKKGPELWYAGSKFQKEFLAKWLADPKPIRPMEYYSLTKKNKGDHAKLSASDAAAVTDYLMSLTSADVTTGKIKAKRSAQGRIIFEKKQGCYGCHLVKKGSKVVGGLTGPTLVGVDDRLNPDWIYAYLVKPKVFKPVKDMPVYIGILTESDMKTLAAYVGSMK